MILFESLMRSTLTLPKRKKTYPPIPEDIRSLTLSIPQPPESRLLAVRVVENEDEGRMIEFYDPPPFPPVDNYVDRHFQRVSFEYSSSSSSDSDDKDNNDKDHNSHTPRRRLNSTLLNYRTSLRLEDMQDLTVVKDSPRSVCITFTFAPKSSPPAPIPSTQSDSQVGNKEPESNSNSDAPPPSTITAATADTSIFCTLLLTTWNSNIHVPKSRLMSAELHIARLKRLKKVKEGSLHFLTKCTSQCVKPVLLCCIDFCWGKRGREKRANKERELALIEAEEQKEVEEYVRGYEESIERLRNPSRGEVEVEEEYKGISAEDRDRLGVWRTIDEFIEALGGARSGQGHGQEQEKY